MKIIRFFFNSPTKANNRLFLTTQNHHNISPEVINTITDFLKLNGPKLPWNHCACTDVEITGKLYPNSLQANE